MRTRTIILATLAAGLLVGGLTPTALAQGTTCEELLAGRANASASPGGQLAEAIGDRRQEIGTELNDRWFDARLANATSERERASIIAAEVDRIERRLGALEPCVGERPGGAGGTAEDLSPEQVEELQQRALTLHRRVNETEVAAGQLPTALRTEYGINTQAITTLEQRVVSLRQSASRAGTASPNRNPEHHS